VLASSRGIVGARAVIRYGAVPHEQKWAGAVVSLGIEPIPDNMAMLHDEALRRSLCRLLLWWRLLLLRRWLIRWLLLRLLSGLLLWRRLSLLGMASTCMWPRLPTAARGLRG
jgi:hypothetical protein